MNPVARTFRRDERGATAIEYGLILAMIVVVIIGAISIVGNANRKNYNTVADAVSGAM